MTDREAYGQAYQNGYAKGYEDGKKDAVVHAEWLDGCAVHNGQEVYKSIDCSSCNNIFKIENHNREYWKARLERCPNCGAKMDGEKRQTRN